MLFGDQIRLRAIERDDIPTFVRWFNDPEVRQFLLAFAPMSQATEERWFEAQVARADDYVFAIEAHVENAWTHIGNVGLDQIDWKNRCARFGIVIGEKMYWGLGFGTDATRTILRFAFDDLNLHRVELDVYDFNPRAMRAYEKAGFQREGTRREAIFCNGHYFDVHTMAILRGDWKSERTA